MSLRPRTLTQEDRQKYDRNPAWRFSDLLQKKAMWGPSAQDLQADRDIRRFLRNDLVLSEGNQGNAHAIGSLGTFWVLDPTDPDRGIWGANIVADYDLQKAQQGMFPMATGYYMHIGDIPPKDVMQQKWAMSFQPGFQDDYEHYYDPTAAQRRTTAAQPKKYPPAFELSVINGGSMIFVAKNANESQNDKDPDNPHPGVSAAGAGKWEELVGTEAPSTYGLPRPLIAYDEATGNYGPAQVEYASVKDAAQKGHHGAQQALQYLGLSF